MGQGYIWGPLFATAIIGAIYCTCARANPPSILNLGTVHTTGTSLGYGLSNTNVVVGESTKNASGVYAAFRWTSSGGNEDLGAAIGASGAAYGIAPTGDIVVGMAGIAGADYKPFRWDAQSGMQLLPTVGGYVRGAALDVNDDGVVVGESFSYQLSSGDHLAFRWDAQTGSQSLGTLGGTSSSATAINASGTIVGWTKTTSSSLSDRAFIWTEGQGMRVLPGLENLRSAAEDISDSGFVTGVANSRPMLWRENLISADLGLPSGFSGGQGEAVNNQGVVAGFAVTSSFERAMLWPLGGPVIDLDAWLDSQLPSVGAFWTLYQATAINDSGMIAGIGFFSDGPGGLPDGRRAFLLDASSIVPEPTGLGLVGLASCIHIAARRKQ